MKKSELTKTSIKDIKSYCFDMFISQLRVSKSCGRLALIAGLSILEDMGLLERTETATIIENLNN